MNFSLICYLKSEKVGTDTRTNKMKIWYRALAADDGRLCVSINLFSSNVRRISEEVKIKDFESK